MVTLADIQIPKMEIGGNLMIILVVFFIVLCSYLIARLRHKQTMAAIEKGTPLSELRPIKPAGQQWIKNLTIGVALLLISLPFLYMFLVDYTSERSLLTFGVLFALGLAFFIRGLLLRKAQRQIQPSDKINAEETSP